MRTIRQQLTRKLLMIAGLLLIGGGAGVFWCARAALLTQFDAALLARAQAISTLTGRNGKQLQIEFADEHMRDYDVGGRDFFELWQADSSPVERSRSLRDAHLDLRHGTQEDPLTWDFNSSTGQSCRALGMAFRIQRSDDEGRKGGPPDAIIVVASTRETLDRTLVTLQLVLIGSAVMLLAITALVVPRVLRRELAPLQRLADEAAQIDAGSLSARFPADELPGELAPVTARLNELLARLEDSFERERRFSSDVAHEFRTPVAELRSMAELAIKLPDTRAANADQETLAIALQLESMLVNLLAMARGERGDLDVALQRVSLPALVQDICEKFQAKASARQLVLNCRADPGGEMDSDPWLLRSILTNLVDNAVEYARPGSTVNVETTWDEGRFSTSVTNTVENLDERDLDSLFDRFWRKDPVRSSDGHTGLGLPLARTFAQSLGCELTARFVEPGRLALTLMKT